MKKIVSNFIKYAAASMAASMGLATAPVSANQFYSPAPIPVSIQNIQGTSYIISTKNGTDFYGASPYYSQKTTDGNLFISSIIITKDRRKTLGTYI
jgi:hypothetical protein